MKTYVVLRSGEEIGVFTSSELKQKAAVGELLPSDEMRQSGTTQWVLLSSVPDFFDTPGTQTAPLTPEDPLVDESISFGISPDSSDLSGTAMDLSPDEGDLEDDEDDEGDAQKSHLNDEDIDDDEIDEDNFADNLPKKDPEQAQSDLARATIYATKNYLRRSIFINQADKIQKYGYVLQCIGIVILGGFAYLVYGKADAPSPILPAAGWLVAVVVGLVAASQCRDAGRRLIASSTTAVRQSTTLDLTGLVIITVGCAILLGMVFIAFSASNFWPAIYGVLALLASVLAAGLVLSPSITNAEIKDVSPMEELLGLFTLITKSLVLLGPFVLACCGAIGILQGGVALYYLWSGSITIVDMDGWIAPGSMLVAGGFFPLATYVFFFVSDMTLSMFK